MFTADTLLIEVCFDILFTETKLKVDDLGNLKRFLQPVTPYWVLIADQLGMTSQVANIQGTVANKGPSDFMRDLLLRWLSREQPCPTLEFFCRALRCDTSCSHDYILSWSIHLYMYMYIICTPHLIKHLV